MAKNIDQNEGSKFRTIENDGFGASKIKYLAIGDLVEWDCWEYNLEDEVFATQNGLLVDIIKDQRISGWVYLARIVPFGADNHIEIPIISVRKMQGTN
jgi:hypothetical protein